MARKTIEIEKLKGWVNHRLADPKTPVEVRKALAGLLENALFETGNYRGFNDLYWMNRGYEEWVDAGRPEEFPAKYRYIWGPDADGVDPCRRVYY